MYTVGVCVYSSASFKLSGKEVEGCLIDSPRAKYFFKDLLHPLMELFLHLKDAFFTSAVRKSLLDMPLPGSFRNKGH